MVNLQYKLENIYEKLTSLLYKLKMICVMQLNDIPGAIRSVVIGNNKLPALIHNSIQEVTVDDLDSVEAIPACAFQDCTSLTNVSIHNHICTIGASAFSLCENLIGVSMSDIYTDENARIVVEARAFHGCYSLKNISFWDRISSLGEGAFASCTSLTNAVIPYDVDSIPDSCFDRCTNLSSVSFQNSTLEPCLLTIGQEAFSYTNITTIDIPSSVTSIGEYAFRRSKLKEIYLYPIVPPSLTFSAFDNVASNIIIHVPVGSGAAYKSATNWARYADRISEDIVI